MRRIVPIVLVAVTLAGCLGAPSNVPPATGGPAPASDDPRPQAVVALIDTGINPYHEAFRDDSELAYTHPSTYLPGYPEDAEAVELTLGADSLENATVADADVWRSLEEGQLYWFPGTKIVGAYAVDVTGNDSRPTFSTGHGTMTASRAAANQHSLCPDCRIAAVQGFSGEAVRWAADQPWIDAQSNSWSPTVPTHQTSPELTEAFADAADEQLVFASAGNGAGGKLGVAGHPSMTRSTSGAEGVVSVGGHDNGQVEVWNGSTPHVVADVCSNLAALGARVEGYGPVGDGTSSASPYAAGAATRLVLETRRILDDAARGDGDVLVEGAPPPALAGTDSPVADGDLTLDEAKRLLFATAVPRPVEQRNDGEICRMSAPYNTYPVDWQQVPEDAPTYYVVGYGQVSVDSLDRAAAVLAGQAPPPDRSWSDRQHDVFQTLRDTYRTLPDGPP